MIPSGDVEGPDPLDDGTLDPAMGDSDPVGEAAHQAQSGGNAARGAAWTILERWEDGRIERIQDGLARHAAHLTPRDRALAKELCEGVVSHLRLYDALAHRFLRPSVTGIPQPPDLLRCLRLACHQLFGLDRIPAHAIGDSMVSLLEARCGRRMTGVANAVIRRLASLRQDPRTGPGPEGRLETSAIPTEPAVRFSLPAELIRDLQGAMPEGGDELFAALNLRPHLCTRSRPGVMIPAGPAVLRSDGPWTWWRDPGAAIRGPVAEGWCRVQDRSQGIGMDLAVRSGIGAGSRVLDLCAAPGGKAAAYLDLGCKVVAADHALSKMGRLGETLSGGGARLVQDGRYPAVVAGAWDLVCVDAPCSNTGVLGRRTEARWRYDDEHLGRLETLQAALLRSAASLVAHDGRLLYCTCSISPRENQAITHRLDGWRILSERLSWPDVWQGGGYAALMVRS